MSADIRGREMVFALIKPPATGKSNSTADERRWTQMKSDKDRHQGDFSFPSVFLDLRSPAVEFPSFFRKSQNTCRTGEME
jgi:hypothetical protein